MLHGTTGRHNIAISQAGYKNVYKEVDVGDTAIDVPQVTLQQPEGTLFLTSTPRGASIRIDGKPVPQFTPAALKLAPGTYSITVERNGASKTQRVQVNDGLVSLNFTFSEP